MDAPILLLHGFTGSAESWGAEILDPLGSLGSLVAVDLPGHGGKEASKDPEQNRIHCVVKEVTRELDRRGIERADWVGYSMGGRVALAAAILRPGRVRRLVLESASPGIRDDVERSARLEADEALARDIEGRGIDWFVERWEANPLFAGEASAGAGDDRSAAQAERARARLRAIRRSNRPEGLARALRGYGAGAQPSFWDRLSEVRAPTLLLTGSEDARYAAIGAEMAVAMSGGAAIGGGEATGDGGRTVGTRHVSVPGVGHSVHREAPDVWIREVTRFLGA